RGANLRSVHLGSGRDEQRGVLASGRGGERRCFSAPAFVGVPEASRRRYSRRVPASVLQLRGLGLGLKICDLPAAVNSSPWSLSVMCSVISWTPSGVLAGTLMRKNLKTAL